MRLDLIAKMIQPRVRIADVERAIRSVLVAHRSKCEEVVGAMYGVVFRTREKDYDARGGRW